MRSACRPPLWHLYILLNTLVVVSADRAPRCGPVCCAVRVHLNARNLQAVFRDSWPVLWARSRPRCHVCFLRRLGKRLCTWALFCHFQTHVPLVMLNCSRLRCQESHRSHRGADLAARGGWHGGTDGLGSSPALCPVRQQVLSGWVKPGRVDAGGVVAGPPGCPVGAPSCQTIGPGS